MLSASLWPGWWQQASSTEGVGAWKGGVPAQLLAEQG